MNKVWFITGAGSGIGAGTAKAALKAGDRVVATGTSIKCALPCAMLRDQNIDAAEPVHHRLDGRFRLRLVGYVQLDNELGEVLVKIAAMEQPPKVFAAGSDALQVITPAVEARLAELRAHAELSRSTDFTSSAAPASKSLP
jgi:hypothetical protein